MVRVKRAIIPAAGLGTRLLPFTKAVPKELLPILETPAIHYIAEEATAAGVEELIVVTAPGKQAIREYFRPDPALERRLEDRGQAALAQRLRRLDELCEVRFVYQTEPRGLGDAILRAAAQVRDKPAAVLLPDVLIDEDPPCLARMVQAFTGETLLAVHEVEPDQVGCYGIVAPHPELPGRIVDLVEKPPAGEAPSRLAITGRYILHPDVFGALAETRPGMGGEVQLTDALRRTLATRPLHWLKVGGVPYDLGQVGGFLAANLALARRRGVLDAAETAVAAR